MNIKLSKIAHNKLKKLGVGLVFLIGSRATGTARKNSDFDFGIVMKNPETLKKRKNKLYEELETILTEVIPPNKNGLKNRENLIGLDIVFLQEAPLYYAKDATNEGKILFESSPVFHADFKEKIMLEYGDMEPIIRAHGEVVLSQI